ncbi:PLP-dependent cysteine synthase family protein [Staphylococcus shinii]|uniref:PLP-dependent cysteine synthase family protein n=1 Tax=Staphylococcus shinii TaxID=2912228 RepID=UPI00057C1C25|nr:cysteine synthase family protein [Staphylococcus shinii]PTI03782.1 cysteine synthase family protein [Staphylococcus shinii]RIN03690.1 cysteine synthase family protein [Staphylococcus shinii]
MIGFDLIGNTPLVLLKSFSNKDVQIYAKLEQFNPGGSIKDRLGKYLIEIALKDNIIHEGDTVVEASAGNTGIGVALAANHYGLNSVIFAPLGFAEEKVAIIKALGAKVIRTERSLGMEGAKVAARDFEAQTGAFYLNQFESKHNPEAYKDTIAQEITNKLDDIDYFVGGVGSGGTFTGIAAYLAQFNIESVIVEPEGSILSGGQAHVHDIEGIGSEQWPSFLPEALVADIIKVSDEEAFKNVKLIAQQEGLLVGSSSGAALQGALDIKKHINKGVIVTVFPDGSDRYMSKQILNYKEKDYE